jgi:hypothetical protein
VEIHNFLIEQDWSEVEEITTAMMALSTLMRDYPSITLLFDENIKVEPWRVTFSCSREQMEDISALGISFSAQYLDALIKQMVDEIKSQLKEQTTHILVTNKKFLSAVIMNEISPGKVIFSLNAYFKVLTIKDLRKLKLKQINEKII